jgi:very-short-patch-repair endonuclease
MPNKLTVEDFIEKSKNKHGNKYDYSKSVYINSKSKIIIICPLHGEFSQTASDHYQSGCGCPECDPTKTLGNEKFIEKAKLIYGDKFDYTNVNYIKNNIKVEINCKVHGSFLQEPGSHLNGKGCPECYPFNKKSTTEDFIKKAKKIWGDLYDYSLVDYTTKKNKVKIICEKHGIFEQKAYVHTQGHGCPICNNSKLENYLRNKLIDLNINFEQNKKYDNCRNKLPLPFDFYLINENYLIECDGIQHRKPIDHFGGQERFEYQKKNDSIKDNWCRENKIKLYRVTNVTEIDKFIKKLISK